MIAVTIIPGSINRLANFSFLFLLRENQFFAHLTFVFVLLDGSILISDIDIGFSHPFWN